MEIKIGDGPLSAEPLKPIRGFDVIREKSNSALFILARRYFNREAERLSDILDGKENLLTEMVESDDEKLMIFRPGVQELLDKICMAGMRLGGGPEVRRYVDELAELVASQTYRRYMH